MAPATWGVAIDVPEMVLDAVDEPIHALCNTSAHPVNIQ
jgi:hypothetical protein